MSDELHASGLPGSVAWVAERLGLVGETGVVSVGHLRNVTVGQILDVPFIEPSQVSTFVADLSTVIGAMPVSSGGARSAAPVAHARHARTRTRKGPTKAEKSVELRHRISAHLGLYPGSTVEEIAAALNESVHDVAVAGRPVDWLILGADELHAPTERTESDAIRATRERARAAMLAANLLVTPLSHQAYTTLLREGRVKGPSVARIVQLFGSWTAACSEVGVTSGEPLRTNYERTWTADDLLGFVERFLSDPVFRGASHQYDKWRATLMPGEKVPSLGTVRNIVGGTWNDIRTSALRRMRARWAAPSSSASSAPHGAAAIAHSVSA